MIIVDFLLIQTMSGGSVHFIWLPIERLALQ